MKYFLSICFINLLFFSDVAASEIGGTNDLYMALALQGDLRAARAWFQTDDAGGSPAQRELSSRFRQRFLDRSEPLSPVSGNALVDDIVSIFRAYWIDALLGEQVGADAIGVLEAALVKSLAEQGWPRADTTTLQDVHALLGTAVASEGFFALSVPAPPLQDLLLWRENERRRFTVELTDQEREVEVVLLTGFVSEGWKHYASLGLVRTTGWVENGVLYCVASAYDLDTEPFEVSFLKHESRHLADYEQFPGLSAVDLEYRAKLTELAFASESVGNLLDDFTEKAAPNPASPHASANERVVRDLYEALYGRPFPGGKEAWMSLDARKINRASRSLLERDSRAHAAARDIVR